MTGLQTTSLGDRTSCCGNAPASHIEGRRSAANDVRGNALTYLATPRLNTQVDPALIELQKALPFIPGSRFDFDKLSPRQHKSHALDYDNRLPMHDTAAPGIGGRPIVSHGTRPEDAPVITSADRFPQLHSGARPASTSTTTATSRQQPLPSWLAFARQVLRFYGYFTEDVTERRDETQRVRRVNVYFYLEDDTIHVSEPAIPNSGMASGDLIRRHRIPRAGATNGQHIIMGDIAVGSTVQIYARPITIVGCDTFTRTFLENHDIQVAPNRPFPVDAFMRALAARKKPIGGKAGIEYDYYQLESPLTPTPPPASPFGAPRAVSRPAHGRFGLKQFLEQDRHVLRFDAVWDDVSIPGRLTSHPLTVLYYLADDTLEILESTVASAERKKQQQQYASELTQGIHPAAGATSQTHASVFLNRGKVRKQPAVEFTYNPGELSQDDFITDRDLVPGGMINVYGRPVLITDADALTRQYYEDSYGVCMLDAILLDDYEAQHRVSSDRGAATAATTRGGMMTRDAPPPEGTQAIGVPLVHAQPTPDTDGITLRCTLVLADAAPVDRSRRFLLSFTPSDGGLAIFETRQRNTGHLGGKFLDKRVVPKPAKEAVAAGQPVGTAYGLRDLVLGNRLNVYGRVFQITELDAFTEDYLRTHVPSV